MPLRRAQHFATWDRRCNRVVLRPAPQRLPDGLRHDKGAERDASTSPPSSSSWLSSARPLPEAEAVRDRLKPPDRPLEAGVRREAERIVAVKRDCRAWFRSA